MKYYVVSDIHGYYTAFRTALQTAGFDDDIGEKRIIILGDLFDRGSEAIILQNYILHLMREDLVILVRGNHEDLFEDLVTVDKGIPLGHHISNGTYDTALQLTGMQLRSAIRDQRTFIEKMWLTPYYQKIIPAMVDYYETENYVFTHAWIPCYKSYGDGYDYNPEWRHASEKEWKKARWINPMEAVQTAREPEKNIVCGHWHASYGHSTFEHRGSEFGDDADFSPYIAPGIIAIDACTGHTGMVNCVVIKD